MKKVSRLLAFIVVVATLVSVLPIVTLNAAETADLSTYEITTLSVRYKDEKDITDSDYGAGRGFTTTSAIWRNYLFVPVNFSSAGEDALREDLSQIAIYNVGGNTPQLIEKWNKTDLGIPVSETPPKRTSLEDMIYGVNVSDEYIYVFVSMPINPASANSQNTKIALYVYKNNLGMGDFSAPSRVDIKTEKYDESVGADVIATQYRRSDTFTDLHYEIQSMVIPATSTTPEILVSYHPDPNVSSSGCNIRITTITEDETQMAFTAKTLNNFLAYTSGFFSITPTQVYDVAFSGNKMYVVANTGEEGDTKVSIGDYQFSSKKLALFTVSFEEPHNPVVTNVTEFDSDMMLNKYDHITEAEVSGYGQYNNTRCYITVGDDGRIYVSTANWSSADYFDEKKSHVFIFNETNGITELISRVPVDKSSGLGKVQLFGNILVGENAHSYSRCIAFIELSEDRTEVLGSYYSTGEVPGAPSMLSLKYGIKFIALCKLLTNDSDINRGVINVVNILGAGGGWEADENKKVNSALENVYASFEDNYIHQGVNTLNITGENVLADSLDVQIVFALFDNTGKLLKTKVCDKHTIDGNSPIDVSDFIDLSEYDNIDDMTLKAYLWENADTIRPLAQAVSPQNVAFTFSLNESAATSAGVYDEDDKLIRTLWSNVRYDAGEYTTTWDGFDDWGSVVPDGNYTVKVLSNNVEYEKLIPVIGNTSDCSTWGSFISSYNALFDMSLDSVSNRIFYCSDHVEGGYGTRYLNEDDLSRNGALLYGSGGNLTATHTATDGEYVYWGTAEKRIYGGDYANILSFIWKTDIDGNTYTFTAENAAPARWKWNEQTPYKSAIRQYDKAGETGVYNYNRIGGLEVQKDGEYLISAYRDIDKVYVNNKVTGADIVEYTLEEPSALAMANNSAFDNIIYIAHNADDAETADVDEGFSVTKYTINSDGTLTAGEDVVTGLDVIIAMSLSPDGQTLAVAQGGKEDKMFVYDLSDNSLRLTYGTGESYYDDPTVKDDKLMFDDVVFDYSKPYEHSFIEFMDNDSLLLGDSGNTRVFKLNVSGDSAVIEDFISFQSNTYSAFCVQNDETNIFSHHKEYVVDYEKLEDYIANRENAYDYDGFKDVWKLKYNYTLYFLDKFPSLGADLAGVFGRATKQPNGYTYFNMRNNGANYIFKQAPDGQVTDTGVKLGAEYGGKDLQPDMSLWYKTTSGNIKSFYSQECIGYDENYNPLYADPVLRTKVDYTDNDRIPDQTDRYVAITDDERLVLLNVAGPDFTGATKEVQKFHLGSLDISGGVATEFDWLAAPQTMRSNQNDFPMDGYFDIGNGSGYTAKFAMAYGNDTIFHFRGEGYKGRQANSFLHFNEDGLLVTVCENNLTGYDGGTLTEYDRSNAILAAQPCNSMSTSMASAPGNPDVAYIFQNTEGAAGGVHITSISGLTTMETQEIPVILKNGLVSGIAYTCFDSSDLDSTTLLKRGVSNNFNIPFITEDTGENRSVRFEGYFKADTTENYRFSIKTDGKVKMVLDSRTILSGEGDQVGLLRLTEGVLYKFMIEVSPSSEGELSYLDVGYMENGEYIYLDNDMTLCKYPTVGKENKVNLLEGFTFNGTFTPGEYGWTYTKSDTASPNSNVAVTLSTWNYHRDDPVDIYLNFTDKTVRQEVSPYYVIDSEQSINRSLGEVESDNWKIDMAVRYLGVFSRANASTLEKKHRAVDGTSIEVLDKNGKMIANFGISHNGNEIYTTAHGNYQKIVDTPKNLATNQSGYNYYSPYGNTYLTRSNDLSFEALGDGKLCISYYGESVIVDPVDSDADVSSPAVVRICGWDNHSVGSNHKWNITKFDLIYDTTK